jgi:hypothetical protein
LILKYRFNKIFKKIVFKEEISEVFIIQIMKTTSQTKENEKIFELCGGICDEKFECLFFFDFFQ